jgi:hypothetical protein
LTTIQLKFLTAEVFKILKDFFLVHALIPSDKRALSLSPSLSKAYFSDYSRYLAVFTVENTDRTVILPDYKGRLQAVSFSKQSGYTAELNSRRSGRIKTASKRPLKYQLDLSPISHSRHPLGRAEFLLELSPISHFLYILIRNAKDIYTFKEIRALPEALLWHYIQFADICLTYTAIIVYIFGFQLEVSLWVKGILPIKNKKGSATKTLL